MLSLEHSDHICKFLSRSCSTISGSVGIRISVGGLSGGSSISGVAILTVSLVYHFDFIFCCLRLQGGGAGRLAIFVRKLKNFYLLVVNAFISFTSLGYVNIDLAAITAFGDES